MKLLITTQTVDKNDPILGFFHRWIEEFAKHFDVVHVVCLKEGVHQLPAHVHVHSLGKEEGENRLKYTWRFYKYFWELYMTQHVDFVFFHMGAVYNIMAAPFFLVRKLKHTQFYWWKTHGHINWVGRFALHFVDRVYTAVAESFPVDTPKRCVVGHAIDTDLFHPREKEVGIPYILFVGRISRIKRVEQFLEILHLLAKEKIDYRASVIGSALDSHYFKELQKKCLELSLVRYVIFKGGMSQENLVKEYQDATVLINPSDNDGMDKVVLEAMACEVVPVTANLSFKEMLTQYSLYIRKGDIDGYVAQINKIFKMNVEGRNELQKELRNTVIYNHSMHTLSKRIFNVT